MKLHGFADNDSQPIVAELVLCLNILSNHRTKQHSLQQGADVECLLPGLPECSCLTYFQTSSLNRIGPFKCLQ